MRKLIHQTGLEINVFDDHVQIEQAALDQINNIGNLPPVIQMAIMPDAHMGHGACVGSVVGTKGAVVPSITGVDIGCGMAAVKTTLRAEHLPDDLSRMRQLIEQAVPHGRTNNGRSGDRGAWSDVPADVARAWDGLSEGFSGIVQKHPKIGQSNSTAHLGTLGTGNHFIEVCLDTDGYVWVMLHSGSRGVGNRIGSYFIERAKEAIGDLLGQIPDAELAWLAEGQPDFDDYVEAVGWAQAYARVNRDLMMARTISAIRHSGVPGFEVTGVAINCHHNYISRESHRGQELWVTRKGAVCAAEGVMGIIPGSMGAKSFIVRGRGNPLGLNSCSHGAGRRMSRNEAKRRFTVDDQIRATEGVECRKDSDVIDEIPYAYKDIDDVMRSQDDLVEVVAQLKQVLCVKG